MKKDSCQGKLEDDRRSGDVEKKIFISRLIGTLNFYRICLYLCIQLSSPFVSLLRLIIYKEHIKNVGTFLKIKLNYLISFSKF